MQRCVFCMLSVITKFELIFGTIANLLAHRSTLSCLAVRHRLPCRSAFGGGGTPCARLILYPDCGRDKLLLRASASYHCRVFMFATTSHLVIVAKLSQYMARQTFVIPGLTRNLYKFLPRHKIPTDKILS